MKVLGATLFLIWAVGCGSDDSKAGDTPSESSKIPGQKNADAPACVPKAPEEAAAPRCGADGQPACETWSKIEVPGTLCSNGSQYKFFVNFTNDNPNLLIMFEPGGACWDYESCSGGLRGAANPNGINDDHMSQRQYINLLRRSDDNPVQSWNLVYLPYCTGDVFGGDRVATYENPKGGDPLTYRHVGLANTEKVLSWLAPQFEDIPQLFVTGCSAGGIASLQNYAITRDKLPGTQCGYLLDDSGPAFHSDGPSHQLHEQVKAAWNLDTLLERLGGILKVSKSALANDFGLLNTAIADRYPSDRFALSLYRMDLNYSLYSYERFFPGSDAAKIHALWWTDVQALMKTFDTRANLAYYVPVYRTDNCSHCVSIPPIDHDTLTALGQPWLGSDIASEGLDLKAFVSTLIDNTMPLRSYVEDLSPGQGLPADEEMMCLEMPGSDAMSM